MGLKKKFRRSRRRNRAGQAGADRFSRALHLHQAGRLEEAGRAYDRLLRAEPDHGGALHYRGVLACQRGEYQQGLGFLEQAAVAVPGDPDILNNLGIALKNLGRLEEALACYQKAAAVNRDSADLENNIANLLKTLGRDNEAVAHYRRAIDLAPDHASALNNLGNLLRRQGRFEEAAACFEKVLSCRPDDPVTLNNFGLVNQARGRLAAAERMFRQALEGAPDYAACRNNLANVLKEQGRVGPAVRMYREAIARQENFSLAESNMLLARHYSDMDREELYRAHQEWGRRYGGTERPARSVPDAAAVRTGAGPIRVGYVSADFKRHPVACFMEPVLVHHDRRGFEIFCYANLARPDAVSARFRKLAHWRDIRPLGDQAAADLIRRDRIDILVDLSGHTQGNRLLVFARKPAPVQATYLGYPDTTGLGAMDYRLTDEIADPPGEGRYYTERLERLGRGFLCFQPPAEAPPSARLPADAGTGITFGSFNNLAKVSDAVLAAWVEILNRVPGARLLLKCASFTDRLVRERVMERFRNQGLEGAGERLELYGFMASPREHLELYRKVDIGLDTFPYNGTTTTCEALWMGVPVVTVMGDRHAGRVGASILARLGLDDLVAPDEASYREVAAGLAAEPDRLAILRDGLRDRMAASTLMDGPGFCRELENVYRRWLGRPGG